MRFALLSILALTSAICAPARSEPVATARFALEDVLIRLEVTVGGRPATAILDTGLDPSGVSLRRASDLGLSVDRSRSLPVRGYGSANLTAYATEITNLSFGGKTFSPIRAYA